MADKNFIPISCRASLPLAQALDDFCKGTKREKSCAIRYLVEIGLAAHRHHFAEGLLKISPVNEDKSK